MKKYEANNIQGWRVSLPFCNLTKSVMDININSKHYDDEIEALHDEQDSKLRHLGYDLQVDYLIHFGASDRYEIMTIPSAIELLAIKDGVDIVEFENGNIGFVGYYHGFNENWFEIIPDDCGSEHCAVWRNLITVIEDDLYWLYIIKNESEVESAVDLIEWSISAWYNTEDYPEYECECIGDVIEEQLTDKCIEYEYRQL